MIMKYMLLGLITGLLSLASVPAFAQTEAQCVTLEDTKKGIEEVDAKAKVGPEVYNLITNADYAQAIVQTIEKIAGKAPWDISKVDSVLMSKTPQEDKGFITYFVAGCRIGGAHISGGDYTHFVNVLQALGEDVTDNPTVDPKSLRTL